MNVALPDGVFETIRCEAGHAFFLERHLARLVRGAQRIGLGVPSAALHTLRAQAAGLESTALRVELVRGVPELVCSTRALPTASPAGLVLALVEERVDAAGALTGIKHTQRGLYERARAAARRSGADDALLSTREGDVCETSVANIWALVDGVLVTPPLERGCLPGIMRAVLLDELALFDIPFQEERLEADRMARASELFVTNALVRLVAVRAVLDLCPDLPGTRGALADRLGRALGRAAERDRDRLG